MEFEVKNERMLESPTSEVSALERCETEFALAVYGTRFFNTADPERCDEGPDRLQAANAFEVPRSGRAGRARTAVMRHHDQDQSGLKATD